jgi:hypothetical protein
MKPGKNNINDKKIFTSTVNGGNSNKIKTLKVESQKIKYFNSSHNNLKFYLFILTSGIISLIIYLKH